MPPRIRVVSCEASGSVVVKLHRDRRPAVDRRQHGKGKRRAEDDPQQPSIDAVLDPAEDADDQRGEPGGEEDDDRREADDLQLRCRVASSARVHVSGT